MNALLSIENLSVEFDTHGGVVHAVRDVSLAAYPGETVAVVGESGCGKTVTFQSVMGLIPMPPGRITAGEVTWRGDRMHLGRSAGRDLRGTEIGMIFQDPMSSLNPTMRIGDQIAEPLQVHRGKSRRQALSQAVSLLDQARIHAPERCAKQYPFELSGGMLQRAMIAMAIACEPAMLIADEPTTALDVTIQSDILDLLADLQQRKGMTIVLVTHDLGVVARVADRVAVMYAGQIVESGTVDDVFYRPAHPYTVGLKAALPARSIDPGRDLEPIAGTPPDLFAPPAGCGYFMRCPRAMRVCEGHPPDLVSLEAGHVSRCWLHHDYAADVSLDQA